MFCTYKYELMSKNTVDIIEIGLLHVHYGFSLVSHISILFHWPRMLPRKYFRLIRKLPYIKCISVSNEKFIGMFTNHQVCN